MNNFKLLAIRPLKGCDSRFVKNLTAGQIYPFYTSYHFYDTQSKLIKKASNQTVLFIDSDVEASLGLYNKDTADGLPLSISISAVAGRNGSGKSSLIELLFAAIYMYSVNNEVLSPNIKGLNEYNKFLDKDSESLIQDALSLHETKTSIEDMIRENSNEKCKESEEDKSPEQIKAEAIKEQAFFEKLKDDFIDFTKQEGKIVNRRQFLADKKNENEAKKKDIVEFGEQLKVEVYYEIDGNFFRLVLDHEKDVISKIEAISKLGSDITPVLSDTALATLSKYFFYSIGVNYSHHALNSVYMGDWINALFLKNDGYTAPIVINPMRKGGNFDINDEMRFARYRLLTNAVKEKIANPDNSYKVHVTDNQFIHKVKLTLNWPKIDKIRRELKCKANGSIGSIYNRSLNLFDTLIADYLGTADHIKLNTYNFPLKEIIINYILQKIERIPETYPWFGEGYQFSDNTPFGENEVFFKAIKDDNSHITYKLKQAINFLIYNLNAAEKGVFLVDQKTLDKKGIVEFEFTLPELIAWMGSASGIEIMQKLPPAIFEIDFILSNNLGSKSSFTGLSSGEQQFIHTIQSVVYHVNNLQSAHLSSSSERAKYKAINIIYDEIELYFHPDYQRRFISDLLRAFERIYMNSEKDRINSINILFLTHSPFILSDIPSENILLLELDHKTKKSVPLPKVSQTFAANINDLLANGFFLDGTLIGKFAENLIRDVIEKIKRGDQLTEKDKTVIALVGDSFLRSSLQNFMNISND